MPLSPGSRLGPYEVVSALGAGGMGEVYRATDLRLGRQVALKILPERLSQDADALARFEREAKSVATLSHPSICTLHDVGREGEVSYLVMELIDGETLADRLLKGPPPIEQVLRIGAQIGDALAAAHDRGIVHRDLKPGNVMLTRSGVKLLDFGLAKALSPAEDGAGHSAPTGTVNVTQEGTLLGTLPYMAPEQLEGKRADARSDIFALGAVLYEMATGRRAFSGSSQASLIAAILTSEPPPVSTLRPVSPPGLGQLISTCLAKDPADRWQSARDVVLQLRALSVTETASAPRRRGAATLAPWVLAGLAVAVALVLLAREAPVRQRASDRPMRFTVDPPPGGAFTSWSEAMSIVVSPDGSALAFAARDATGKTLLWLRPLSSTDARPLPGTEGASSPFWSPDSRSVGFTAQGKLKRLDLSSDAPITLCEVPPGESIAATWGRDSIVFESAAGTLSRVPAAGGAPVVEITADSAKRERRVAWPSFLPDGERLLYLVRKEDTAWQLMLAEPGRPPRELGPMTSAVEYLGPGYLVFVREGTLVAQRFDLRSGTLSGEPVVIADSVRYFVSTGAAAFSASASGMLAYQPFGDVNQLVWFDRTGRELGTLGVPAPHLNVEIGPQARVIYDRARTDTGTWDVWSWEPTMAVESRVTTEPTNEVNPRWLQDGKAIVYSRNTAHQLRLTRRDLASGREDLLVEGDDSVFQWAEDVSPDGDTLVFYERRSSGTDLWTLSLSGRHVPRPLLLTPFHEEGARFSVDGRYLAFVSNESGRREAYVMPFPGPGEKRRISSNGARAVRWSPDGREILFLSEDGQIWSVPVDRGAGFRAVTPSLLLAPAGKPWVSFDVAADGRLLAVVPVVVGNEMPATVLLNWSAGSRP